MRKLLLPILIISISISISAQDREYKKGKVGLQMGYVIPDDGSGGGVLAIEPGYRITDDLHLGLRMEGVVAVKEYNGQKGEGSVTGSFTLNGSYYITLGDTKFRPFVGVGAGWYIPGRVDYDEDDIEGSNGGIDQDGTFGFYPRIGFDFGRFNFLVDYNMISETTGEYTFYEKVNGIQEERTTKIDLNNSYLAIKLGLTFGTKK